ncbi:MAG: DNA repair protein RadA [Thermacetogeniaceae bacterium]
MVRERIGFFCSECGHESGNWLGRCPGCGGWNTFREAPTKRARRTPGAAPGARTASQPVEHPPEPLVGAAPSQEGRLLTHSGEMDRVLGGGIVAGSVILLGGDPGIGKSTLLLQLAAAVGNGPGMVLYVSGEESRQQVQLRAGRLGISCDHIYFSSEADLDHIRSALESVAPALVIIDSIQTMSHPDLPMLPGSIGQLRECTAELVRLAKLKNFGCFLIGHVTKDGALAGPRVLEHMVDTVLSFEGDHHQNLRLLRAVKNRFGATNEIAVFTMGERGLEEVANPSALFLDGRALDIPGSVVVSALEGTRPVLVEIQALICPTVFGAPRRATTGVDYNRVVLTAAVLEKRAGLNLTNQDIYVSVVGGLRVVEPAVDLGVALALASNFRNIPVDSGTVVMGEIGLTGEVRAVSQAEQRIREAVRLGFRRFIIPERNLEASSHHPDLEVIGVKTVREAIDRVMSDE